MRSGSNIQLSLLFWTRLFKLNVLSRDWVAIDGFWIDNWIHWALIKPVTTPHTSLSHTSLLSQVAWWRLQRRTFPCFRAHVLAGCLPSRALPSAVSPRAELNFRQSQSLYDWRFTANQFILAPSLLRLTTRVLLFSNWTADRWAG
jgi:hypothetical protein